MNDGHSCQFLPIPFPFRNELLNLNGKCGLSFTQTKAPVGFPFLTNFRFLSLQFLKMKESEVIIAKYYRRFRVSIVSCETCDSILG